MYAGLGGRDISPPEIESHHAQRENRQEDRELTPPQLHTTRTHTRKIDS